MILCLAAQLYRGQKLLGLYILSSRCINCHYTWQVCVVHAQSPTSAAHTESKIQAWEESFQNSCQMLLKSILNLNSQDTRKLANHSNGSRETTGLVLHSNICPLSARYITAVRPAGGIIFSASSPLLIMAAAFGCQMLTWLGIFRLCSKIFWKTAKCSRQIFFGGGAAGTCRRVQEFVGLHGTQPFTFSSRFVKIGKKLFWGWS